MVKIEILTKNIVEKIVRNELLKVENRFSKELNRLRKRVSELEDKNNQLNEPLKLVRKNQK